MSCKIIENSTFNYIHTQNHKKSSRIASYGHIEGALNTFNIKSVRLVAYRTSFLWTLYTHTSAVWCHMAYQAVQNFLAESIRLSRANPKPKYELPEQPIQKQFIHTIFNDWQINKDGVASHHQWRFVVFYFSAFLVALERCGGSIWRIRF